MVNRVCPRWKMAALGVAAEMGLLAISRLLIRHGADANVRGGGRGETALQLAIRKGDARIVRLLLQEGRADPNLKQSWGWAPIHYACCTDHEEIGRLLLEHKADINLERGMDSGPTALEDACFRYGKAPFIRMLLENGANANQRGPIGNPILRDSAELDRSEAVQALLEFGANFKTKDRDGKVALEVTCEAGSTSCIYLLFRVMIADGSITAKKEREGSKNGCALSWASLRRLFSSCFDK